MLDLANFVPLLGGAFTALIGAASIHSAELDRRTAALQLSQAEIRRLASVAERERIGRDLHDLLGHTLSLIVIKAQFAAKLASRGDCRAEQEIREVEGISRDALREVREVVTGFRRSDLDAELANARLACEAAGIRLTVDRAILRPVAGPRGSAGDVPARGGHERRPPRGRGPVPGESGR